ncbi:MAG: Glycosyl transferase, group 1 family protein [Methanothrix sp.]|jgi:glycosyltransferase involved in cell wall biosynthesis|nr:MAG: Glycosyl transferase, group 1 family protein [Methanothrix sp.]
MVDKMVKSANGTRPKIRVAFICYSPDASFIRRDYKILSKYFSVEKFNYRRPRDAFGMMRAVWRSDVSFSWFAAGHAFLAVLFSKSLRKKSVVVIGGYEVAYAPEINYGQLTQMWHKRKFTEFVLRHADLVLPVSDFTKGESLHVIKPKNIAVIYNSVDTDKFRPSGKKRNLIITVASGWGSVIKLKGLDTFVTAAIKNPELEFAVLGLSEIDMATLEALDPSKNVKLLGHLSRDELIKWYQEAKVYCQLSYRESFGMALAEAMSCECIPVVTDRGALPEVVGDTGFYVPYGDPEATAEATRKAITSSENLRKRSRERVMDKFCIERRETELLKLLRVD